MEKYLDYSVVDNKVILTKGEEKITLNNQELLSVLIFAIASFTENTGIKVTTNERVFDTIEAYTGYKLVKE